VQPVLGEEGGRIGKEVDGGDRAYGRSRALLHILLVLLLSFFPGKVTADREGGGRGGLEGPWRWRRSLEDSREDGTGSDLDNLCFLEDDIRPFIKLWAKMFGFFHGRAVFFKHGEQEGEWPLAAAPVAVAIPREELFIPLDGASGT
jgi:hypothetical protein